MLVENGSKVQKLYGSTVDAERATQEVERQLSSVEGQQEELSSWLDRYEREVDEMMSKQVGPGEALQGPDQERERTYVFVVSFLITGMVSDVKTLQVQTRREAVGAPG